MPPPPITTRQSEAMGAGAGFSLGVGSQGEWFAVGINIVQQGPATKTRREERSRELHFISLPLIVYESYLLNGHVKPKSLHALDECE